MDDKVTAIKNLAVKMGLACSCEEIQGDTIVEVLNSIEANYAKAYDLFISAVGCTITVTKNGTPIEAGTNKIHFLDQLVITATPDEGKTMSSLTINGATFVSGQTYTVSCTAAIAGTAA